MVHVSISLCLAALMVISHGVNAKRGCSAFGHSCFGGHGKRSGDTAGFEPPIPELIGHRQLGQEETPPHPGYPHTFSLPAGDDIIPVRDGGVYDHDDSAARKVLKYRLRNIVKHWMDTYRRAQNDDGYILENL